MENGETPSDERDAPLPPPTGALTDAERRGLRERAAQARTAASEATAHYAALFAQSQRRISATQRTLAEIDATRETIRQCVQRYATALRKLDTPPECMLRLVKETVTEQLPHPEREPESLSLVSDVVGWVIESYYGT